MATEANQAVVHHFYEAINSKRLALLDELLASTGDTFRIASAGMDATFQVWDALDGGQAFVYRGHSAHCFALTWSPDSRYVASASWDATVQVWSPPS